MSLIIGFRYQKRLVIFVFADFNYTLNTSFQHLFDLLVSLCVIKITDFKNKSDGCKEINLFLQLKFYCVFLKCQSKAYIISAMKFDLHSIIKAT